MKKSLLFTALASTLALVTCLWFTNTGFQAAIKLELSEPPSRPPVDFDLLVQAIREGRPTQGLRPVAIDDFKSDPDKECRRATPALKSLDDIHFLHIPKTGGWFIEDVGMWRLKVNGTRRKNIWGRFGLEKPALQPHPYKDCLQMHTPQSFWWDNGWKNWLRFNRTFCVVREPLQRAVSMTRFRASTEMEEVVCKDEGWLNAYVLDSVEQALHVNHFTRPRYSTPDIAHIGKAKEPKNTCSWIPQSQFVFDDDGCRICDDVLEFSSLGEQLDLLMRAYGFDGVDNSTNAHEVKKNEAGHCNKFTVESLLPMVQEVARVLWKTDYDRLIF